jgi:hypothetical protein
MNFKKKGGKMAKDNCDRLNEIADRVNYHWKELFDGMQDLAEWICDQEICPDMRKPCSSVPIFRKVKDKS